MTPTESELTYFLEIFSAKHLSRSALRLGISQPALSQSLSSLEKKTGAKLFHRTKAGMVPTKEGQRLYSKARHLIESWQGIAQEFAQSRDGLQGKFRIGCHQAVASYCMPPLVKNLEKSAPGIQLELVHSSSKETLDKVAHYEVDLGFVVNPAPHPDVVLKKIGTDQVRFWTKKGIAKPAHRIFCDLSLNQVQSLMKNKQFAAFAGWSAVQSSSLEVVRTLTRTGLGVGILPTRVALAEGDGLVPYRPSELPVFEDTIYLAYRKDALEGASAQVLLQAARTVMD